MSLEGIIPQGQVRALADFKRMPGRRRCSIRKSRGGRSTAAELFYAGFYQIPVDSRVQKLYSID